MSAVVRASLLFLTLLLVAPSVAEADVWRPISSSCVRFITLGTTCTAAATGGGLWNIEVAPGGNTAYGAAYEDNALLVFDRDPTTGRLTQRSSCFRLGGGSGCSAANGIQWPSGIAISDDGRSLYVASWDLGLARFDRDPNTGNLTYRQCFNVGGTDGCGSARGVVGARDVHISPDQRSVYTGPAGAIATFNRNVSGGASHGSLTQAAGTAGCIMETPGSTGCADATGLGTNGRQFALSADGTSMYAGNSSLAVLKRNNSGDASHGAVSQDSGAANCFALLGGTCTGQIKLLGAQAVRVGPSDKQVYVTTGNGVLVFARATNGALTFQSCINDLGNNGCATGGKMLSSLTYLDIPPDGEDLVANVGTSPVGIVTISRDPATGNLSQRAGTNEVCVSSNGQALDDGATVNGGCLSNSVLTGNGFVDFVGNNVFHVGAYSPEIGAIATFKRDFAPQCPDQNVEVVRDTSVAVSFGCSDRNGDALNYSIPVSPIAGNLGGIDNVGARVFYNPFGGFVGADSFRFRATGGGQSSRDVTVSLNVVAPPPSGGGGPVVVASGLDGDGDGFFAGQDCNDANKAIRPGAVEIKGNRIDENCDGLAEPFPTITSGVVHNWSFKKGGSAFTLNVLRVTQQFPKGWKAQIKCSGKKCPLKTKGLKAAKVRNAASNVITSLTKKQRKFRAGQTVEIWISAPEFNTKVARIKLKKGKQPVIEPLCVVPDQTRPQKSCA